jgi:rare lipoprotein A
MIIQVTIFIIATFYSNSFVGKKTSSGDIFSQNKYTCATLDYRIGTRLIVENVSNGKKVSVIVNDKCRKHGIIDLSLVAFRSISNTVNGRAKVKVTRKN